MLFAINFRCLYRVRKTLEKQIGNTIAYNHRILVFSWTKMEVRGLRISPISALRFWVFGKKQTGFKIWKSIKSWVLWFPSSVLGYYCLSSIPNLAGSLQLKCFWVFHFMSFVLMMKIVQVFRFSQSFLQDFRFSRSFLQDFRFSSILAGVCWF